MIGPFVAFRFKVSLTGTDLPSGLGPGPLCDGLFSEVTGLEATTSPKTIREGGRNFGMVHRPGPTAFGSLTLKRGITGAPQLWTWFDLVSNRERYGRRLQGRIEVFSGPDVALTWTLVNVLPIRFKAPDLAGNATQVAIEELQLAYERLSLEVS